MTFVTRLPAPDKRARYVAADEGFEFKLTEGAVQIAVALALLADPKSCGTAEIYPDGEHAKRFPIREFLIKHGFSHKGMLGTTEYGGVYERGVTKLTVNPKAVHGRGDVVSAISGVTVRVECKGGTINSKHAGVQSRLRSGFAELIGQAMAMEDNGDRHVIALPLTDLTETQAKRLSVRCLKAGIEIALVRADGSLHWASRTVAK
jgi:hypothetical protein